MMQGQPGFFEVNRPGPWFSLRGSKQATSYYDSAPLRETLLRLVDFDRINNNHTRFACGAVNVSNGNFYYFDNANVEIMPEHVMASGALPPALPMVRLGSDYFWDGGLVSNTPLQHLLDRIGSDSTLVFQVDLFSARGNVPRDMYEVLARQKDIQYSSRTRLTTDLYKQMHQMKIHMRDLLARIPEAELSEAERAQKAALGHLPEIAILQLIYQQAAYEGEAKDYEFSGTSMREHWESGYRDTQRTLAHKNWLVMPEPGHGIVMHDIHRVAG
jgi:NTE family protein